MSDQSLIELLREANARLAHRSRARRFSNESPLHASSIGSLAEVYPMPDTITGTGDQISPAHTGPGMWANSSNQGFQPEVVGVTLRQILSPLPTAPFQLPTETADPMSTVVPAKQEPKKPMTTILSLLPKTTYKEANGAEGTSDTFAYLKVQRELLKYLDTRPADDLTSQQACRWTKAISANGRPTAQDALRLCYYMRSQTFDTYADVKLGSINLYVANQNTVVRGPRTDMLYWRQSITTNVIAYGGTSSFAFVRDPTRTADLYTDMDALMAQLTPSAALSAEFDHPHQELEEWPGMEEWPGIGDEDEEGEEDEEAEENGTQDDGEEQDGAAADGESDQNSLAIQVERAEANVHRLLASEPYDADAVNAALMQLEEYNRQLHAE